MLLLRPKLFIHSAKVVVMGSSPFNAVTDCLARSCVSWMLCLPECSIRAFLLAAFFCQESQASVIRTGWSKTPDSCSLSKSVSIHPLPLRISMSQSCRLFVASTSTIRMLMAMAGPSKLRQFMQIDPPPSETGSLTGEIRSLGYVCLEPNLVVLLAFWPF